MNVFFLDVDKAKLLGRLNLRSQSEGRADDADISAVEKRFDEYMTKTAPVKEYFETQNFLTHIRGDQSEDAEESKQSVHREILAKLGVK